MEFGIHLIKDPIFVVALLVFLTGAGVLVWAIGQLRMAGVRPRQSGGGRDAANPAMVVSGMGGPLPEPSLVSSASKPAAGTHPMENDAAVMYSVLEERFAELSKRIAQVETTPAASRATDKSATALPAANLDPLMKRLAEVEEEINKIKLFIADSPAPPEKGTQDLTAISQKVATLQKILEGFTADTEIAKPS